MIPKSLYDGRAGKGVFSGFLVNFWGEKTDKKGALYASVSQEMKIDFVFSQNTAGKMLALGLLK